MCHAYNRQFGTRFLAVMPTNLYGAGDNYDLQNSHVLPALIRKMHEAKLRGDDHVVIWGTGSPRREFLFSDDLAEACVYLMKLPASPFVELLTESDTPALINIGCGEDQTIKELADLVKRVVGFERPLKFDTSKPDGSPRKLLDVSKLHAIGWMHHTPLLDGIKATYSDFLARKIS